MEYYPIWFDQNGDYSRMKMFDRILNIKLPSKQSAFLWGARKTGKSTYLKNHFPNSTVFDFLKTDFYFKISKNPAMLRELILAKDKTLTYHFPA